MAKMSHQVALKVNKRFETKFSFAIENFNRKMRNQSFDFDIPGLATW